MKCKDRYRLKAIELLSNPDDEFCNRCQLAESIGISRQTLYRHFSPEELIEIEKEALELRRARYAPVLARIDKALIERAATGDPAACRLAYQRFEGWTEKQIREHTGKDGEPLDSFVHYVRVPEQAASIDEWAAEAKADGSLSISTHARGDL